MTAHDNDEDEEGGGGSLQLDTVFPARLLVLFFPRFETITAGLDYHKSFMNCSTGCRA